MIEVIRTRGSVPREAGTRMLVAADATLGTIGGGHLEWHATAAARQMLRSGDLDPHTAHFPLGPALGQCCGGDVTLGYRPLDAAAIADWPIEPPHFHLQLHGAGHVGAAVATLLATLNIDVDWIDERDDAFPTTTTFGSPWPERIRRTAIDSVETEVARAPAGAFFLVMTHRHDLDLLISEAILARGDFGWFGLIGSKTKRERFIHRFERRGFDAATIARITCPIGLTDIDGKEPAVIAVAVVAQMLQCRAMGSRTSGTGAR